MFPHLVMVGKEVMEVKDKEGDMAYIFLWPVFLVMAAIVAWIDYLDDIRKSTASWLKR